MSPRAAFGPRLRAHRERRGITLQSISETTKIKLSLLAGLERSDLSQWPRGLFRRAYVRDYAVAVGLDPQPLVAEFVHLFPEDGAAADVAHSVAALPPMPAHPLRLTLALDRRGQIYAVMVRLFAAAGELAVVLLAGSLIAFATGTAVLAACGALALLYYPVAAACTGRALRLQEVPVLLRRCSRFVTAQMHAVRRNRIRLVGRRFADADAAAERDERFSSHRRSAAS